MSVEAGLDSSAAFEEVFYLAKHFKCDMVLLALMNWCITSVVKLHLTRLPLIPSPIAS
jgi:hypothetical protein